MNKMKDKILQNVHLLFPILMVISVAVFRIYYTYVTGFISPDEALYFSIGWLSQMKGEIVWRYPNRFVFQLIPILSSMLLDISDIMTYICIETVIFVSISIGNIVLMNEISKHLPISEDSRKWNVFFLGFCVTFVLYSSFIITEPFVLFLALVGILCMLNIEKHPMFSLVAGLGFMIASTERKPYLIFYFANLLIVILTSVKQRKFKNIVLYLLPVLYGYFMFFEAWAVFRPPPGSAELYMNITKSYNTSSPVKGLIYPRNVERLMDRSFLGWGSRMIYNTCTALFLGWCPVLNVAGLLGTLVWIKEENYKIWENVLLLNTITGFLAILGTWYMQARFSFFTAFLSIGLSIRFAHVTLPSFFSISKVFKYFSAKNIFIATVVSSIILAPLYMVFIQTNLSESAVNRLSIGYVTPWKRLCNSLDPNEKTLVICEPILRPSIFTVDIANTTLVWALGKSDFEEEYYSESWDRILIYGELHQIHWKILGQRCPWHIEQVYNRTEYKVGKIWWDNESYLLEVIG